VSAEPFLRTTWTDPVTGRHGYLVIDRLVGGIAGGGTRVREGCSLQEVERLAHAMTLKNGGLDLPVGGSKCGLDIDPHDSEAQPMLVRYFRAMRPFFETYVATGEDMGTTQAQLLEVFREAGMGTPFKSVLAAQDDPDSQLRRTGQAFGVRVDGIDLIDLVGGYGVAEATLAALGHLGLTAPDARVSIQGFGSMGGSTARYLAEAGVRVVALADAGGVIANPAGLDVPHYLSARNVHGEIDRARLKPGDTELPREEWLTVEAEVLVPAAVADAINEENCDRVRARLVVEAANIPTTAEAERRLRTAGVLVIPDFIANAGTNGWAWWVLLGMVESGADAAFAKIAETMRRTVGAMLALAEKEGISPREAAVRVAMANSDRYVAELGAETKKKTPA
jgi:glutamate dehydrogenase (NAD(P)+)